MRGSKDDHDEAAQERDLVQRSSQDGQGEVELVELDDRVVTPDVVTRLGTMLRTTNLEFVRTIVTELRALDADSQRAMIAMIYDATEQQRDLHERAMSLERDRGGYEATITLLREQLVLATEQHTSDRERLIRDAEIDMINLGQAHRRELERLHREWGITERRLTSERDDARGALTRLQERVDGIAATNEKLMAAAERHEAERTAWEGRLQTLEERRRFWRKKP